jgi:hypothetical protein
MITMRVYRHRGEVVLAACDKHLIGRTMREGQVKLDVCASFYEGEDADAEMLLNRIRNASIANLVGEETVGVALENELVDEGCVMRVEGVPHVQLVRM